ncbi:MAG TPA: hypothetical protein VGV92_01845 [Gammaproteobacteria bacterium]|nr:hypothetical protein [Gammaproteobacteria bacterium]
MDERKLLGKTISRFNRKAPLKLFSIPTYPIELFKRPHSRHKRLSTTQRLLAKPISADIDMLNVDNDVMLTQEREKYIILFIAQDEVDAKEKYGIIARTSGTGSTSPTHKLPDDFSVSLQDEAVIIHGSLETLLAATKHLYALEYISEKKKEVLCEEIQTIQDRDSDTESSDRSSSDTESVGHTLLH